MADAGPVYRWPGPPSIELWREDVVRGERHWRQHRLVVQGGATGAVAVVQQDDAVLLVRQWRPVVGRSCWELPRGFGDPTDRGPVETAHRELAEETGLRATAGRVLATIWPDTGILAGAVAVVLVTVDGREASGTTDQEVDDVRWVPSGDLDGLITSGELFDGISLAALAVWRAARQRP